MAAGPAPGAGQDPPPRGEPSRPASGPSAPSYSAPGQSTPGQSTPGQSTPGQSTPGQSTPGQSTPGQSTPGQSTPGQSTPGQSTPGDGAPPASASACGEAGAWWEGDELVDEDDLEAAGWADPPGQPLDERAVRAARAACISAEVLGAGFWPRADAGPGPRPGARTIIRSRSGFGSGDDLDELAPGAALAGLADTATGPGRMGDLDDDELIGALRAWRRLESWTAAGTLAVVAELARRRPADRAPAAAPGQFPGQPSEFVTDEIAAALTLTGPAAGTCLDLAMDLAIRLPGTAAALRAGIIDYLRARIIAEATRVLSDQDARRAEDRILARAGQQTSGQLRAALARTILAIDPAAAQRRREQAQKDPRIRRWREDAGTAALAGYGLPPADVLEADQHLTERALHLREAGLPGTLDELRARAYLDALLGRHPAPTPSGEPAAPGEPAGPTQPAAPAQPGAPAGPGADHQPRPSGPPAGPGPSTGPAPPGPSTDGAPSGPFTGPAPSGSSPAAAGGAPQPGSGGPVPPAPSRGRPTPGEAGAPGQPAAASPASAPTAPAAFGGRLAARINLTVPLATLLGLPGGPGDIGGFGPIDPALARDITARAAAHPSTSWSLTITRTGQAIAHGPIPARRARRFLSHPSNPGDSGPHDSNPGDGGPGDGGPHDGGPGRRPPGQQPRPPGRAPGSGDLTVTITPLARGSCRHRTEEFRYEPSRRLQDLIRARTATCSAPGCRRPAARCDLDHTIAFDHGGRSCECNLAPLCRHHHRCKQAQGWRLEQISPGIMRWTTPAGRRYITRPTSYD